MKQNTVRLTCAQFDPKIFDSAGNLQKIAALGEKAAQKERAELVVFPEAAVTGYCFANREEAEKAAITRDGAEFRFLRDLSTRLKLSLVVGSAYREGETLYNAVFFFEPTGEVFTYHKSHLPFLGLDRFVTAGDTPGAVFPTRFGDIGVIVCYDLRFPESARAAALGGARLILQPTNLPLGGESHPDFLTRARACENRVYFASCNRVGTERGFSFIGRSQILAVDGSVLAETAAREELITRTLDLTRAENKDIIGTPGEREMYLFRDRRPGMYGALTARGDTEGFVR
jgi:predicted amidohydrolase